MIFWILIGLVVLTSLITFIVNYRDYRSGYYSEGFWVSLVCSSGWAALAALAAASVAVIAFTITGAIANSAGGMDTWKVNYDKHSLTALKTSNSIDGQFYFLGGGYIKDKRVLNYIQNDGGEYRLEKAYADHSIIHESTEKPYVLHSVSQGGFWWLAPFPVSSGEQYDFYVPKGSVLSDYTVDNG